MKTYADIKKDILKKKIPYFKSGDSIIVSVLIREGSRKRIQNFEGIVISKKNGGINSSFTVRKISHNEGVERTFKTYSNIINKIKIKIKSRVRSSKIYFIRKLKCKSIKFKKDLNRKK